MEWNSAKSGELFFLSLHTGTRSLLIPFSGDEIQTRLPPFTLVSTIPMLLLTMPTSFLYIKGLK